MTDESAMGSAAIDAAVTTLTEAGYLVFKAPECNVKGHGHGRHTLMTRSATCPGEEPMPHGFAHFHMGSFGPWIGCRCGRQFSDVMWPDDPPDRVTPWAQHKAEHGIEER